MYWSFDKKYFPYTNKDTWYGYCCIEGVTWILLYHLNKFRLTNNVGDFISLQQARTLKNTVFKAKRKIEEKGLPTITTKELEKLMFRPINKDWQTKKGKEDKKVF